LIGYCGLEAARRSFHFADQPLRQILKDERLGFQRDEQRVPFFEQDAVLLRDISTRAIPAVVRRARR
jgi:hypothetical protein